VIFQIYNIIFQCTNNGTFFVADNKMFNIIWFGTLLLFANCLVNAQNPSILAQPGGYSPNILSININTKKCIHTVSDHFLSIALEPSTIFSASQKNLGFVFVIYM